MVKHEPSFLSVLVVVQGTIALVGLAIWGGIDAAPIAVGAQVAFGGGKHQAEHDGVPGALRDERGRR